MTGYILTEGNHELNKPGVLVHLIQLDIAQLLRDYRPTSRSRCSQIQRLQP